MFDERSANPTDWAGALRILELVACVPVVSAKGCTSVHRRPRILSKDFQRFHGGAPSGLNSTEERIEIGRFVSISLLGSCDSLQSSRRYGEKTHALLVKSVVLKSDGPCGLPGISALFERVLFEQVPGLRARVIVI